MKYKFYLFGIILFSQSLFAQKTIQCYSNTFWAVGSTNTIDQFSLNAGVATLDSTILNNAFAVSLAYCNNLDTGSLSQTFYNTDGSQIAYYNGAGWSVCPVAPSYNIYNGGGFDNYLYFTADIGGTGLDDIVKYDGISLSTLYTINNPTGRSLSVADVAVDDMGNAWFFTGANGSMTTDSLLIVSPSGLLLAGYPVSFYTQGAYGCFLLNGIIYVGLGAVNPVHPNSLLPISISNGVAVVGTAIAMPLTPNYADLASCSPGTFLAVNNPVSEVSTLLYPNPASGIINITCGASRNSLYKIYDIKGSVPLITILSSDKNVSIDIRSLSSGMYILSIENETGISRRSFVKL